MFTVPSIFILVFSLTVEVILYILAFISLVHVQTDYKFREQVLFQHTCTHTHTHTQPRPCTFYSFPSYLYVYMVHMNGIFSSDVNTHNVFVDECYLPVFINLQEYCKAPKKKYHIQPHILCETSHFYEYTEYLSYWITWS
jgi:hypothetical protein